MPSRKKIPSKAFRSKTFPKTQARIKILGNDHKIKKSKKPISSTNKKDHDYESTNKPLRKRTIEKILEDFDCDTSKTIPQENDLCHPPKQNTSTPLIHNDPKHLLNPRKLTLISTTPPKLGLNSRENQIEMQSQLIKEQFSHISQNLVNVSNMMEKMTFSNLDITKGEISSVSGNSLNSELDDSFNRFIDAPDSSASLNLPASVEKRHSHNQTPPNITSLLNKDNSIFLQTDPPPYQKSTQPSTEKSHELDKSPPDINAILNKDNSIFLLHEKMSPGEIDPPLSSTLTSPETTSKIENSHFFDDNSLFYSQSRFSKYPNSLIKRNFHTNKSNPVIFP